MNLSNVLSNFNSSLTNCNNTSEPCSEQNVSPMTPQQPSASSQPTSEAPPPPPPPIVSPSINKIEIVDNKLNDDPLDVNHHHQSSNRSKNNNNGHCIRTDSNANNDDTDDEMAHVSHVSEVHHHQSPPPMKMCCVSLPEATDGAHAAVAIINTDGSSGDGDHGRGGECGDSDSISKQQQETSEIQPEITTSDISGAVIATPATATTTTKTPPIETDPTADEGLDVSKKHTSTDGINGPTNDVRV